MLIIKEIGFIQRKIIGIETDEKLIEISLTKTKLKIVFNLEKIITIKKIKIKKKQLIFLYMKKMKLSKLK